MRVITALLIVSVALTGGMAAMAADSTAPDAAVPVLETPQIPVSRAESEDDETENEEEERPVEEETVEEDRIDENLEPSDTRSDEAVVDSEAVEGESEEPAESCVDAEFCESPPLDVAIDTEAVEPERVDGEVAPTGGGLTALICDDVDGEPDVEPERCDPLECTPINHPPEPLDDRFVIDASRSATELAVLNNDSDPDDDPLTIADHTSAPGLTCGASRCAITPTMAGTFVFRYVVSDGIDEVAASVTIVVIEPASAQDDAYTVDATSGPTELDVLGNDELPSGSIIVSVDADSSLGTVECSSESCTFTPAGPSGTTSFTYQTGVATRASSPRVNAEATVVIEVVGPPQPEPDLFEVTRNSEAVELDVLANDSDPDGDDVTIVSNTTPTSGAVVCDPMSCQFTPGPDEETATFEYTVSDGVSTGTTTVTVSVTGDDDPPARAEPPVTDDAPVTTDPPTRAEPPVRRERPTSTEPSSTIEPPTTTEPPATTEPSPTTEPESTSDTPSSTVPSDSTVPSTSTEPSTSNDPPATPQRPERTARIVRPATGVVANSAPTSGSALSLVSVLWLLAPVTALLRRRRHDPSDIDSLGG